MIRPTGRAVLAFVCGIPLALIVAIYNPDLWVVSFAYGAMVLLAGLTDVSLAFPARLLDLKVAVPDHVSIGDRGAVTATIAATRWSRATTFGCATSDVEFLRADIDAFANNLRSGEGRWGSSSSYEK